MFLKFEKQPELDYRQTSGKKNIPQFSSLGTSDYFSVHNESFHSISLVEIHDNSLIFSVPSSDQIKDVKPYAYSSSEEDIEVMN